MTLTQRLLAMFETCTEILNGEDREHWSAKFPLDVTTLYDFDDMDHPIIQCWTYERYNGCTVLRIDIKTEEYSMMPVMDLNRWVAQRTGEMPFASVYLKEGANRRVCLGVTHAVVAEDLTENSLKEIIDGMVYMWTKCSIKLRDTEQIGEEGDLDMDDEDILKEAEVFLSSIDEEINNSFLTEVTPIPVEKNMSADQILAELNNMIGLEPVKHLVHQLTAQQMVAKQRAAHGLKAVVPSPHLVFTGNPGTGKTTVARLVGQLYKSLGLLSSGHVIEADRSTLVAAYIGQTAIKTKAVCEEALNGVLFIDEAYSLIVDGRDYGREAIEALLTFMESHRNEFVLVVAGYPDKMQEFLNSNPGLRSRFDVTVDFPDYSTDELTSMFVNLTKTHDYVIEADAIALSRAVIDSWERRVGFGNGRDVRSFFNAVVANHATKMAFRTHCSTEDLKTLTTDLIPVPPSLVEAPGPVAPIPPVGYL